MKQFTEYQKNYQVTIRKVSESFISKSDGDTVLNESTKQQGILYSVSIIKWEDKNNVEVSAGSYVGNLGSQYCTYTLKRQDDKWKIVSSEDCVVS